MVTPFIIIFRVLFLQNWSNPVCVSYNFSEAGGNWSAMGCTVLSVDEDNEVVVCGCSHLTNFGVLVVSYWWYNIAHEVNKVYLHKAIPLNFYYDRLISFTFILIVYDYLLPLNNGHFILSCR